jgi:CheY-like chemotaxis protein
MKKKILLVDDIKEFRTLVKIILSGNYDVVTAEDGEDALNMIEGGLMPDVIVTDLMMPRVDGYQFISRMRSENNTLKVPVIVLSNVDKVTDRERLKEQGVSSYLIKPFNTAELKEGLGRSLITALSQQ